MRKGKVGGEWSDCGKRSAEGLFWANELKVLDFGFPGMAPLEPDTTEPERCDGCELLHRLRRDFEADPGLARRVWGPYLRLIGE